MLFVKETKAMEQNYVRFILQEKNRSVKHICNQVDPFV